MTIISPVALIPRMDIPLANARSYMHPKKRIAWPKPGQVTSVWVQAILTGESFGEVKYVPTYRLVVIRLVGSTVGGMG
jgi:hypothetical protein